MRVLLCCVLLVALEWSPETAAAISKKKACRQSCGAAVDACVASGGKRKRCKRQTLKRCRQEGVESCTVTTTTTTPSDDGSSTTTVTVPGVPTTTLETINGCTTASAKNRTAPTADRTVEFAEYFYDPQCMRIRAGQAVTFASTLGGDFDTHPLVGGRVVGDSAIADPTSPIPVTAEGTTKDVTFPNAGTFPYYCGAHGVLNRMFGVIYVDPPPP
jgi:plastocyanin